MAKWLLVTINSLSNVGLIECGGNEVAFERESKLQNFETLVFENR